ncbi:hypothetical protein [Algivirga pacifica]|uniref:Uncharacterized protein n=1 Tax=Algivirga pacifica TaxID=1162670 RepID=A0ABP9CZ65_9BACT
MLTSELSENQISNLISTYESELNELRFKLLKTEEAIAELQLLRKQQRMTVVNEPVAKSAAPVEVPSTVTPTSSSVSSKPVEEEEVASSDSDEQHDPFNLSEEFLKQLGHSEEDGYRLSEWDYLLLKTLKDENRLLLNHDFIDAAREYTESKGKKMTEEQLKGKVVRSLNKLVNKREYILKHNYKGKGYCYGLSIWFFKKSGKLKKEWKPKEA